MKPELKPCPFCGGEVDIYTSGAIPSAVGYPLSVHVTCRDCSLDMAEPSKGGEKALRAAEKRAAERWNRRAERTCRLTYDSVHADYVCSSCGEWLEDTDYDAYAGEERVRRPYRFCPSCGARVVGE